jgi:hypothetical protein
VEQRDAGPRPDEASAPRPALQLFVFDPAFSYLVMDTTVTILEEPRAIDDSVRMFRHMQGREAGPLQWFSGELPEDEFRATLEAEGRLIYEFEVVKSYGLF